MKARNSLILIVFLLGFAGCVFEPIDVSLEGSWQCEETSEIYMKALKGTSIFPVYIAQDAMSDSKYYVDNFYNMGSGSDISFTIIGRSISISKQSVSGIEFEGSAILSSDNNTIEFTYTADDGGGVVDHVTATYTR